MRFSCLALTTLLLLSTSVASQHHLRGGGQLGRRRNLSEALMKRVIVTYQANQGQACKASMMNIAPSLQIAHEFEALHAMVVMVTPEDADLLQNADFVVDIEEDVPRYPLRVVGGGDWSIPAPKMSTSSSGFKVTMQSDDLPYGLGLVQAPDLWEFDVKGNGVTVCVIDSGIDSSHEDLSGVNGYSGQSNLPWNQDVSGHGTHVVS